MMKKIIVLIVVLLGICVAPVFAVTFDPNDIYISTWGYGLQRYNVETGVWVEDTIPDTVMAFFMEIAFAPDGKLWAPSPLNGGYVHRFDELGLVDILDCNDCETTGAEFIKFGPDGNAYVGYPWSGDNGVIQKYDGATGELIGTLLDFNSVVPPYPLHRIGDLAFDPNGDLLVHMSVSKLYIDGQFYDWTGGGVVVAKFDRNTGAYLGQLYYIITANISPKGLAVGRQGSQLAATSYYSNRVDLFHPVTGATVGSLGGFGRPRGVTYGPDGSIYVVDEYHELVTKFDINMSRTTDFIIDAWKPTYATFMPFDDSPPPPECGDATHPYPAYDLNMDCIVGFADLAMVLENWLGCTHPDCD